MEAGTGLCGSDDPNNCRYQSTARIGIFDVFLLLNLNFDPMTFIHQLDPYCALRYTGCAVRK